jgi:predicted trehalose synthase
VKLGTVVLVLGTLTACGSIHTRAPGTSIVVARVPDALTEPVAEPQLPDNPTNGSLAKWADDLKAALREANRKLAEIRKL